MRQISRDDEEKPTAARSGATAEWLAALSRLRRRIATSPPRLDETSSPSGGGQSNRSYADAKGENPLTEKGRRQSAKTASHTRARSVTP